MKRRRYVRQSRMPASADEVFRWHARPGAFERLSPPWAPAEIVRQQGTIRDGDRIEFRVSAGPFRRFWIAEHRDYVEGAQFRDVQVTGPFAHWQHTHRMRPLGPDTCLLEDEIEYALPAGSIGDCLGNPFIEKQLDRAFAYRHRVTFHDLSAHLARRGAAAMKVLVTGSTGLVGSELVPFLTTGGHEVTRLVRSALKPGTLKPGENAIVWQPTDGKIESEQLEGFDAVVHLAGESIAGGRWTAQKKARIRDSRVEGTRLLAEALASLKQPPKVLVCASAIGYYGDRGDTLLDEQSSPGTNFLAEVCQAWEAAADPARERGIRVVHLRFGMILSPRGGALQKMLMPFKFGLGGRIGSGKQQISWILLDDVIGVIHHALTHEELSGPVNVVTPFPVTNAEFTRILGKVLGRPTIAPVPAVAAKLIFGQMADELLLASTRVEPRRLVESGYSFRFPDLEGALRHTLGQSTEGPPQDTLQDASVSTHQHA